MSGKVFLSHSSHDKDLVSRIAQALDRESVWFDAWNLELGNVLPQEIAQGVDGAGYFVLIASKASMNSPWVRYELNLALVRWIQERNLSLVIIKIDDCELHPEIRPFLYKDCSANPDRVVEVVTSLVQGQYTPPFEAGELSRDRIIDRFDELKALEDVANEGVKGVLLWGIYGIGKTSIAEKAARTIFQRRLESFRLSESHGIMRLSFELCARASIALPEPASPSEGFQEAAIEAITSIQKQGKIVLFEDIENILTEENELASFFSDLLLALPVQSKVPIVMACTRLPNLGGELAAIIHPLRVQPLSEKHLVFCLERWVKLADPKAEIGQGELSHVAAHLDGYPMAAKLAAPLIAVYGVEPLLRDLRHLTRLRIDMAKQLIGRSRAKLSDVETNILEILAVDDTGVSAEDIAHTLALPPEPVREGIDTLTKASLIRFEGSYLTCHPLIRDYVWQRAYDSKNWKKFAMALGLRARQEIENMARERDYDAVRWVHLCTKAYRLLVMSGDFEEASKLTLRFEDELRGAGHRFYHAREYSTAHRYLDFWVNAHPHDDDTRILRARCLTRLKRYDEAWADLGVLEEHKYPRFRIHHAKGLWYRDQERFGDALEEFRKGRDLKGDYLPLLRDLGDMLARNSEMDEALKVLETAYNMARNDRFIVPKYADVLEQCGKLDEALTVATRVAHAFPDEAGFQHRVAVLLAKSDRHLEAMEYARRAAELDPGVVEHVLHCAAVEVRLGYVLEAQERLRALPDVQMRPLLIKHTVLAGIALAKGDTAEARRLLARYQPELDHYVAELHGRICLTEATNLLAEGKVKAARERVVSALGILENPKWEGNVVIQNTAARVRTFHERLQHQM